MSARHAKLMFLILIVLVTLLFFVHVPSGGFQSKNGPTTPVNNLDLRVALAGLLLLLGLGGISFIVCAGQLSGAGICVFLFRKQNGEHNRAKGKSSSHPGI
jgi:hypothetical protein